MNTCIGPECHRKPDATKELCLPHYKQKRRGGELQPLGRYLDPLARDDLGRKQCSTCREWKEEGSYYRSADRADGLTPRCKTCKTDEILRKKWGISLDRYNELLEEQNGGCATCFKTPEENGRALAVDHDHSCCPEQKSCGSCVRGLLCTDCNIALGKVRDSQDVLRRMVGYLGVVTPLP